MIEYFSEEVYNPDPNDSSQAIPYTVTKSIVFILLGSIFVVVGYIFCILGQCMDHKSRFTLLSGVIFIQTGLAMLCGLIMYIAVFKAEVGSKLRPKSHLQPPTFSYAYGYSFCVYVTAVVCVKLTGVCSVFLYIYRVRYELRRKRAIGPPPVALPVAPPVAAYRLGNGQAGGFYPCKRHPEAYVDTNSALRYPRPRQVFQQNHSGGHRCSVHHNLHQTNSLRDVSFFHGFPPEPPVVPFRFPHHFSTDDLKVYGSLPRDMTANTVSTTVEYFDGDYSPNDREQEFLRFDLEIPAALEMIPTSGSERNLYDIDTLRRTTPV
ncbi:unnamed protein product [Phaedon cochleariae]|uniref:Uncharacterized protein n=1 Tax=Phaedon cochleariae TaxID=80249 RepID=A0A9N9X297_PHACE|nr:unnamed protein product [Phaedon cochleariae]